MRSSLFLSLVSLGFGCALGCSQGSTQGASTAASQGPPPAPTATSAEPLPAVGFQRVSIELLAPDTQAVRNSKEIFADGRVVFAFGPSLIPSVARASAELLTKVDAWAKRGPTLPPPQPTGPPPGFLVRVRVVGDKTQEAVYPGAALPPAELELERLIGALANSPQVPLECAQWSGAGDFKLTFWSQDFGAVPGPIHRTTFKSDGGATRERAGGGIGAQFALEGATTLTPAEIDAIRAALVAHDLGRNKGVFGGAGEGSDFRGVELVTAAGSCGRTFTNQHPAEMKPLLGAVEPATTRLWAKK